MVSIIKKGTLLILAFIGAVLITEFVFSYIIGYPKDKIESKIYGIRKSDREQNQWSPYSKSWNVEGGNHVYSRNNLGFSGIDASIHPKAKYILVLGSSYLEAMNINPSDIAVSLLQKKLKLIDTNYNVINLSYSGHDPYDLFFRVSYYEKFYHPTRVLLVLDCPFSDWLKRHKRPLDFSLPDNFGEKDISFKTKVFLYLKAHSCLFTLFSNSGRNSLKGHKGKNQIKEENPDKQVLTNELFQCLLKYQSKYNQSFSLVSIMNNDSINTELKLFCERNNINYNESKINIPEYKTAKKGHLTEKGNQKLGELLYESFIKVYKK